MKIKKEDKHLKIMKKSLFGFWMHKNSNLGNLNS